MVGRYEISDNGWAQIEDIVAPPQTMGRPRRDDRKMLNGIFITIQKNMDHNFILILRD